MGRLREDLGELISIRVSEKDLEKMDKIRFKWEEEQPGMIISRSDVLRISMRATYDHEFPNTSLKESLTNSS